MTESADLQKNYNDSISEYNYWSDQVVQSYAQTQDDLKKMLLSADSMMGVMFALMNVFPDCIEQTGSYLGQNGGMLDVQASLSSYVSHMQTFFAEGKDLDNNDPDSDATQYLQEMQAFYKILNDPSTPLSDKDRSSLLDSLNSIASAYGNEAHQTTGQSYTPMDLYSKDLVGAQTSWYTQSTSTDGGKEDGNYNAVNMGFQQMNTQLTALNGQLTTQQKVWSDLLDQYQAIEKDAQDYIKNVDSVSVNNEMKT